MPPELPTQDSALEDSVSQLSRVQSKLVDTLHALQLLPPHLVKDHNRAVRAVQEALTLVGDTDDSEAIGPIDWVKFGERLFQRRTAAALTQEWLADRVGVTATTIRQLEHHNSQGSTELDAEAPGRARAEPARERHRAFRRDERRLPSHADLVAWADLRPGGAWSQSLPRR
jgi:hypothetical protein